MTAYTVRRVNTETGDVRVFIEDIEKLARSHVFWCAHDNLLLANRAAAKLADSVRIGEPVAVDRYVFTIEPAATS